MGGLGRMGKVGGAARESRAAPTPQRLPPFRPPLRLSTDPSALLALMDAAAAVYAPVPPPPLRLSADPSALLALMDAAAAVYAPAPPAPGLPATEVALGAEERAALIEGLARVVAGLPAAHVGDAGLRLVQPLIGRAQSLAQAGEPAPQQLADRCGSLVVGGMAL